MNKLKNTVVGRLLTIIISIIAGVYVPNYVGLWMLNRIELTDPFMIFLRWVIGFIGIIVILTVIVIMISLVLRILKYIIEGE